jgi:hypothetical protein
MQFNSTFQVYQFHFGRQQLQSLQNYDRQTKSEKHFFFPREKSQKKKKKKVSSACFAPEIMTHFCAAPQTFVRVLVPLEAKGPGGQHVLVSYGCGCGRRIHRVLTYISLALSWDDATFRSTATASLRSQTIL